jgi:hypothetical protein
MYLVCATAQSGALALISSVGAPLRFETLQANEFNNARSQLLLTKARLFDDGMANSQHTEKLQVFCSCTSIGSVRASARSTLRSQHQTPSESLSP